MCATLKSRRTLFALGGIMAAALLLGYAGVGWRIAEGVASAERKAPADTPAAHGLLFEEVSFPSRRGDLTLLGWYVPAQQGGKRLNEAGSRALIFTHGLNGERSSGHALALAERLAPMGYSSLLYDLRGHGASEGKVVSGGYFEEQDVLGAFDYLRSRGTPPERIGALGFSMGAAATVLAAAQEPELKAVIADSPFANVSELLAQETARKTALPEWLAPLFVPGGRLAAQLRYGIKISELVPERAAAQLGYPILVIHGEADTRIPAEHGRRVFAAAPAGSKLWLLPGLNHTEALEEYTDEYARQVEEYLSARLGAPQAVTAK